MSSAAVPDVVDGDGLGDRPSPEPTDIPNYVCRPSGTVVAQHNAA